MVTQISLGNFNTINGKNVLTGGASNLDVKGIVEGLVKARRDPAVRLETTNKVIDNKTTAFTDLKAIFTKFQSAVNTLRNPPGVDTAANNIFEYRKATLTGTGGVVASSYLDVTVEPGAATANYTIDSITQLAKATKQQTGTIAVADATAASAVTANGSPVAGLFRAGTVNLRAVDGTVGGIPITLAQGDSLQTVAGKFNEVSSRTGIQATVLNVSAGSYKLIFTATKTGTTYGFDLETTGVASDPTNVLDQIAFGTIDTAQNAIFSIDGNSVTREGNAISDAIDEVTFTLKDAPTPAGTIKVDITPDGELVKAAVQQLVDAYNEFRLFVSQQSELDEDGLPKETAVLNSNTAFRTFINDISDEVSRLVSGITGSNPSQLSEIGLKLENFEGDDENLATKNILTVDEEALESAIASNFSGVRSLFEYRQTSDNANFLTFKRSNSIAGITSFQVSIDQTTNTYTATYSTGGGGGSTVVNLDYTAITGGGVTLKGQDGTVFEGMEFIYATTGDTTVNITLTQGYGDRFHNLMTRYLDAEDGVLTNELDELTESKTRNEEQITQIDERLTKYREQLLVQYAALESAITRANQILQLLDAQANARNSGS